MAVSDVWHRNATAFSDVGTGPHEAASGAYPGGPTHANSCAGRAAAGERAGLGENDHLSGGPRRLWLRLLGLLAHEFWPRTDERRGHRRLLPGDELLAGFVFWIRQEDEHAQPVQPSLERENP